MNDIGFDIDMPHFEQILEKPEIPAAEPVAVA